MDEPERGRPFQQRHEEPSPQREVEESSPNGGPDPVPGEAAAPSRTDDTVAPPEQANEDADAGAQVMGNLPRTRPQRRSGRRTASAVKATPATTPKRKPATRRGQGAKSAAGARSATSSAAKRRPTSGQAAPRRAPEAATRTAARKRAPGIPQLAAGAALRAAKLPLKVTATITRRATELIGRGLRLR